MIVRCALFVWRSWCDGFKCQPKGVSGCFQPVEPGRRVSVPVDATRLVRKITVLAKPAEGEEEPTGVKVVVLKVCRKRK